ncbi:MAG: hypothetical protein ACOC0N_01910 [Chroococcales cyanobacterium]
MHSVKRWFYLMISVWATVILPLPSFAQPTNSASIFENVRISPRFAPDPLVLRGISGGMIPASDPTIAGRAASPTGPCVGYVDRQPDHTVTLTGFFNFLNIQVQSDEDTTLVIKGPGGSWCNDDVKAKNPGVAGQWLEGEYGIWVGSYDQNEYHPYRLRITQVE